MTNPMDRTIRAARAAAVILGVTLIGLPAAALASPRTGPEKLARQVDIMARIVDKVLLDSPNFLVHTGENVTGFYLPDYGAVFAFDASLTDEYFDGIFGGRNLFFGPGGLDIRRNDGDDTIVIKKKHSSSRREKDQEGEEEDTKSKDPSQLYDLGKEELVQALLDYSETLSGLPSGQSVVIVANVKNDRLWKERKHQQLVIRAAGDDLKAFANDRLSESDLRSRIRIEEN